MDSITVSHKLVEDTQFLLDCFRYISKDQCFQPPLHDGSGNTGKTTKKKAKETKSVFQDFPQWFGTKVGYTIYQWIAAYFEYLVTKR